MEKTLITEVEVNFQDIKDMIVAELTRQGVRKPNESIVFDEAHCRILVNAKVNHKED